MIVRPARAQLGIDLADVQWKGSGEGPGTVEVASLSAHGTDWVLLRVQGGAGGLVSVFTRFEWQCFLDGAKKGEFDQLLLG